MNREHDPGRLTDHEYDGIQEYDNPLPRWWVYLFYATIAFSLLYALNVPGVGIGRGRIANYERDLAALRAVQQQAADRNPVGEVTDASLAAAARDAATLAAGRKTFADRCAVCHRADGGGSIGPNLTDEYWIHGGRPSQVFRTVATGVLDKGMPAWGQVLKPEEVRSVAAYVLTLRGTHPPAPKPPQGTEAEEPGEAAESHP